MNTLNIIRELERTKEVSTDAVRKARNRLQELEEELKVAIDALESVVINEHIRSASVVRPVAENALKRIYQMQKERKV
jgi:hypothetical protein